MPPDGADFYRSLLARDPALASVRALLAERLLADGDADGAVAEAGLALAQDPSLPQAWLARGAAHRARHDDAAALADFGEAARLLPDRVAILVNLAHCYAALDRLVEAARCLRRAVALAPRCKEAWAGLGSVLVMLGELDAAEAPCRQALALDPDLVVAHQNLSGILLARAPMAARWHRDCAYRRQPVFIEAAPHAELSVLVLAAADAANVPLRHLMPRARTTLIHWYVEYARADQDLELPQFDLVFNAIGDADLAPDLPETVRRLLANHAGGVLNAPERVARTARVALPALLADIADIVVPRVIRAGGLAGKAASGMVAAGMEFPVLARPPGTHGGEGVQRISQADALPEDDAILTQFVDYVSQDGGWRKYRCIFVAGRPYPYHLAISRHWLVHHSTAGMEHDPARRAEEAAFLAAPETVLGARAWGALVAIGARLDLDYAGIDFALLEDGRVLVFEANATMLVHPEHEACFAYRNAAVREIQAAFVAMLGARVS